MKHEIIAAQQEAANTASEHSQAAADSDAQRDAEIRQLQDDMRTCIICQDRAKLFASDVWAFALPRRCCPSCEKPFQAKRVRCEFHLFV